VEEVTQILTESKSDQYKRQDVVVWATTNIMMLHYAVPIIAIRSTKLDKNDKQAINFYRKVGRIIMKIGTAATFESHEMSNYNEMVKDLTPSFRAFSEDVVTTGNDFKEFVPSRKRV
jgi:hypothetical protein